jgi:hypothetical protein
MNKFCLKIPLVRTHRITADKNYLKTVFRAYALSQQYILKVDVALKCQFRNAKRKLLKNF